MGSNENGQKQDRREWALQNKIHPDVLEDARLVERPEAWLTTYREWCGFHLRSRGITDQKEIDRRWTSMQRWPQRRENFPAPLVEDPPRFGKGRSPDIFDFAVLEEWAFDNANTYQTKRELINALESMSEPLLLVDIAKVLGVHKVTVYQARDASLLRQQNGEGSDFEIPEPVEGAHYEPGALYPPQPFAVFWEKGRPGQGLHKNNKE